MESRKDAASTSSNANGSGNISLYIFGSNAFNNHILADFLHEHTGIPCRHLGNSGISDALGRFPEKTSVVLIDHNCLRQLNAEESACLVKAAQAPNFRLIVFQVNPERKDEFGLFRKGVWGIFYSNQSISLYPKAIRSILEGELWYPRRILEQIFLEQDFPKFSHNKAWYMLTARQKQILQLLAAGHSNSEIADKLCLSPHTVKTHIYHIYKKLGVGDRLEACAKISEFRPQAG